jgi:hypothetical protein
MLDSDTGQDTSFQLTIEMIGPPETRLMFPDYVDAEEPGRKVE